MADEEGMGAGFSLADLADLDVSGIEEVRFVELPAGVYEWEITGADLAEYEKDGIRKFRAEVEMKILEVRALLEVTVPPIDKEALIGKLHTERMTVDPSQTQEDALKAIGRIRAFVADVGMPNEGKLGDIVRNLKGHTFTGKIVKQTDRDDKSKKWARLQLDPAKR